MPKAKLFDDDSDEDVTLKTENEYAKKYDTWREKEEIHKLEQKYGTEALNSDASLSSDSEDESDEPLEVSEEVEEQFLKTLALLKTKDPRIYDPNYKFFEEKQKEEVKEDKKKTLTFADSDEDDDDDGNIFSIEKKAQIADDDDTSAKHKSTDGKEVKLKEYLMGKVEHIDEPVEKDLAPLKALWSDPQLNEGEAFLRDYILNKPYLDEDESESVCVSQRLRDDEALEADARRVQDQGHFERAYNFRFEEPDHDYLKRFPRTMNYIRPKDDRRSKKRTEVRERKEEEKKKKMEEIARLKALKLKEIQEKIAKIKEVTGNDELAFKEDDIEGDFDPEEHDRRMKAIFDEQFYGDADDEKPVFPDLDEELEIENWDNYEPEGDVSQEMGDDGLHCEDEDFNMDADHNPKQARANLLKAIHSTLGKKRRNRKKKSKLAKLLSTDKPTYIPDENKTYDQYMEEYYKMDCEDVIGGDLPTRFKYREVVPNDYGLTVEEILLADDKELTQWVPLKRLVKHRPESVQKSEVNTYKQKAADVALKKKILPSLFKQLPEEPELVVPKETKKKKKKKKNKDNAKEENELRNNDSNEQNGKEILDTKSKKKKKDDNIIYEENANVSIEDSEEIVHSNISEQNIEGKKKKKKHKNEVAGDESGPIDSLTEENEQSNNEISEITSVTFKRKKNKKNNLESQNVEIVTQNSNPENDNIGQENLKTHHNSDVKIKKKMKNNGFKIDDVPNATPSQESESNYNLKNKANLKRKSEDSAQESRIPNKKKKNKTKAEFKNMQKKNCKDFKKFNKKDKFKHKGNESSDNPLSKLSDERLKAYGLNPKKYRSFLKYKKF